MVSEHRILSSLDYFDTSKIQRLAFTTYGFPMYDEFDESLHSVLDIMEDLRTLFLNRCNILPFISALDPDRNPKPVRVPNWRSSFFVLRAMSGSTSGN